MMGAGVIELWEWLPGLFVFTTATTTDDLRNGGSKTEGSMSLITRDP
jgi:hypothetical protein